MTCIWKCFDKLIVKLQVPSLIFPLTSMALVSPPCLFLQCFIFAESLFIYLSTCLVTYTPGSKTATIPDIQPVFVQQISFRLSALLIQTPKSNRFNYLNVSIKYVNHLYPCYTYSFWEMTNASHQIWMFERSLKCPDGLKSIGFELFNR